MALSLMCVIADNDVSVLMTGSVDKLGWTQNVTYNPSAFNISTLATTHCTRWDCALPVWRSDRPC
jgi:hypothetical protein